MFALAATSTFSVSALVGGDTTPPTTPTLISVTPVDSDQIDLNWTPSTDDFLLSGYTIRRDGLHIATTTLTTYSDNSLTPEALYEYSVQAFDWLYNFSSSSNALSTTTLAVPIPPVATTSTSTTNSESGSGKLSLQGQVEIVTDLTGAVFSWQTSRPSRFVLRWGKTTSYELGFIASDYYSDKQRTTLSDLTPGTTYQYELVIYNRANNIPQVYARGKFKTKVPAIVTTLPNVTSLSISRIENDVSLSWKNPQLEIPFTIRVVRNHLGYPSDPYDGMVIYQGFGEAVADLGALGGHPLQYYTVFVTDKTGNVSSGAIARVGRSSMPGSDTADRGSTSTAPIFTEPDILLPLLEISAIKIYQLGVLSSFAEPRLLLSSRHPFTVKIPAASLPAHLKSIIITLLDPTDHGRTYRFLLRLNPEGTFYESTFAPLGVTGVSHLLVEVYDYESGVVGRYGKQIDFTFIEDELPEVIFPDAIFTVFSTTNLLLAAVALLLIGLAGFFGYLRKRVRSGDQNTKALTPW